MKQLTIKCCNDCKNFWSEGAKVDQPYPEFICTKGHWDGIESTDDLFEEVDCVDFIPQGLAIDKTKR